MYHISKNICMDFWMQEHECACMYICIIIATTTTTTASFPHFLHFKEL